MLHGPSRELQILLSNSRKKLMKGNLVDTCEHVKKQVNENFVLEKGFLRERIGEGICVFKNWFWGVGIFEAFT